MPVQDRSSGGRVDLTSLYLKFRVDPAATRPVLRLKTQRACPAGLHSLKSGCPHAVLAGYVTAGRLAVIFHLQQEMQPPVLMCQWGSMRNQRCCNQICITV